METKYSRTQFEGFTHRFIVQFETELQYPSNINIYSNSDSYQSLDDFINEKKSKNVKSFIIIHRASREQDEIASMLIQESLDNW